ncbi:MAG: tetratricopeptide repeat protein [Acidobacteriota bacterium]|nr:tetratricopeptide repeat protein [Blastocatellia bacterium]MDW8411589.1 tetratricopeptide repeat protein [Acidobacteriota bacterium]
MSTVVDEFKQEVQRAEPKINLAYCALLIAKNEYPKLEPQQYLSRLDEMAAELCKLVPSPQFDSINWYLFDKLGFSGNRKNYYDPKNSFLNEVLDRKLGIPITLSIVYLELAFRLNIEAEGVGLPGHFLVRVTTPQLLLDPFNKGKRLSEADCHTLVKQIYGEKFQLRPEHLRTVTKLEILARMLSNLKNIYVSTNDSIRALKIIDLALALNPKSFIDLRDRGLIQFQLGNYSQSLDDLTAYLNNAAPDQADTEIVKKCILRAKAKLAALN